MNLLKILLKENHYLQNLNFSPELYRGQLKPTIWMRLYCEVVIRVIAADLKFHSFITFDINFI